MLLGSFFSKEFRTVDCLAEPSILEQVADNPLVVAGILVEELVVGTPVEIGSSVVGLGHILRLRLLVLALLAD